MVDAPLSLPDIFGSREPRRVFEAGDNGTLIFHGYTTAEVADLLALYRDHLRQQMRMVEEFQGSHDAVHYQPETEYEPVGPEDIST